MKSMRWFSAMAIVIVAIVSLVISALPTLSGYEPHPGIHDEFAYLLQGDTFAHGRLTNPPHQFWQAFETFHVLQQPTYTAKFPPGQGMALAVGEVIWKPILGVWLSVAIGCAAVTWLMLGFFNWRWALLGGLLTASSYTVFWWTQIFWGGGVAMIGGALLGGAAVRIVRRPGIAMGIIAAIGMGILANSRPFEGFVYSVLIWMLVLIHVGRSKKFWMRVAPTIALFIASVFAWMGYYNWRVTGHALEMPYVEYQKQYGIAPLLFWEKPSTPPTYRQAVMENFYKEIEWDEYQRQLTWQGFFAETAKKLGILAKSFLCPQAIVIGLLAGCFMFFRSRAARWSIILCLGALIVEMLCTPWLRIPYMGPLVGFFNLLALVGLWLIWQLRWGKWIVIIVLIAYGCEAVYRDVQFSRAIPFHFGDRHAELVQNLSQKPGKFLVIVHYSPLHLPNMEEVYNAADIDDAKIVFAHDMGTEDDLKLMNYFHDRTVVYWDVDYHELHIIAHPAT